MRERVVAQEMPSLNDLLEVLVLPMDIPGAERVHHGMQLFRGVAGFTYQQKFIYLSGLLDPCQFSLTIHSCVLSQGVYLILTFDESTEIVLDTSFLQVKDPICALDSSVPFMTLCFHHHLDLCLRLWNDPASRQTIGHLQTSCSRIRRVLMETVPDPVAEGGSHIQEPGNLEQEAEECLQLCKEQKCALQRLAFGNAESFSFVGRGLTRIRLESCIKRLSGQKRELEAQCNSLLQLSFPPADKSEESVQNSINCLHRIKQLHMEMYRIHEFIRILSNALLIICASDSLID